MYTNSFPIIFRFVRVVTFSSMGNVPASAHATMLEATYQKVALHLACRSSLSLSLFSSLSLSSFTMPARGLHTKNTKVDGRVMLVADCFCENPNRQSLPRLRPSKTFCCLILSANFRKNFHISPIKLSIDQSPVAHKYRIRSCEACRFREYCGELLRNCTP